MSEKNKENTLSSVLFVVAALLLIYIPYYLIAYRFPLPTSLKEFGECLSFVFTDFFLFPILPSVVLVALGAYFLKHPIKKATVNTHGVAKQNSTLSNAEELIKYKELLDSGVITKEEFEAKKKKLL